MKALCFPLALILSSCAGSPAAPAPGSLSPSELIQASHALAGKRVLISGWLQYERENYSLWDTEREQSTGNAVESCVSVFAPAGLDLGRFHGRYVSATVTFRDRLPNGIFLGMCNYANVSFDEKSNVRVVAGGG